MLERLRSRNGTLLAATGANFGQFGARVVISPFVLAIATMFDATKGEVGLVLTLMWAVFALLQFPSGVLADRFGERRVIVTALALTTLGSLLVAVAPDFLFFAVAAIALGTGAGLYFAVGSALLARQFENHGRVLGIHSAGGPIAGLALPVVATTVAAVSDWRAGVAVGAITATAALVLVLVLVPPTEPADPGLSIRSRLHPRSALALLARPGVAFTTLIGAIGMYVFQSFVSFFPAFLQEFHGFDEGTASLAFGVVFGLFALGLPVVGSLADRYGTTAGIAGPFLVTAAGFATVLVAPARPVVYAGVFVMGAGLTWGGAIQSRFMAQFPDSEQASGFGVARTVFVLLGAGGNVVTGVLASRAGWPAAYGLVVALLLLGAVLLVVSDARNGVARSQNE